MTSITVLAHAAHATAPTFNADFYTTAAAVIPVLFLSVNVQPVFRYLASAAAKRKTGGHSRSLNKTATIVLMILYLVLFFGFLGEITAIKALAYRTANHDAQSDILLIMILLTIAAVSGPFLQIVVAIITGKIQADDGQDISQ